MKLVDLTKIARPQHIISSPPRDDVLIGSQLKLVSRQDPTDQMAADCQQLGPQTRWLQTARLALDGLSQQNSPMKYSKGLMSNLLAILLQSIPRWKTKNTYFFYFVHFRLSFEMLCAMLFLKYIKKISHFFDRQKTISFENVIRFLPN